MPRSSSAWTASITWRRSRSRRLARRTWRRVVCAGSATGSGRAIDSVAGLGAFAFPGQHLRRDRIADDAPVELAFGDLPCAGTEPARPLFVTDELHDRRRDIFRRVAPGHHTDLSTLDDGRGLPPRRDDDRTSSRERVEELHRER